MQLKLIFLTVAALWAVVVSAGDIAMDVRQTGIYEERGGYFEVGIGLEYASAFAAEADGEAESSGSGEINLGGAYYYKGLFIEAAMESLDGLNLGYQLVNREDWSLDLLATSLSGEFTLDSESSGKTPDQQLVDRTSLYNGAGIRVTRYLGDAVLQGRLVSDIYQDNGVRASMRLGRNWQVRNWNLHGIVSYDYASAETMQYLVGITDDEATETFEAYTPSAGSAYTLELGAAYPVSEHVVWNTRFLHTQYSDEVTDSPLIVEDDFTGVRTTLNYVF